MNSPSGDEFIPSVTTRIYPIFTTFKEKEPDTKTSDQRHIVGRAVKITK